MKYTGVFATQDEVQMLKDALNPPYMMIGGYWPDSPQQVAHRIALKHDLPEIKGYYGCDLRTGEFVSE